MMPDYLRPFYTSLRINEPVELARGSVELALNGESLLGGGVVRLEFHPSPRAAIEGTFAGSNQLIRKTFDADQIAVRFDHSSTVTQMQVALLRDSGNDVELSLIPASGSMTICHAAEAKFHSLTFHVLNFPDFINRHDSYFLEQERIQDAQPTSTSQRLWRADLRYGGWQAEIQSLAQTRLLCEDLRRSGGFAITHVGRLSRTDGEVFTPADTNRPLNDVQRLLSFARGGWAGLFGVVGANTAGEAIYREWGARIVNRWKEPTGWFDLNHGEALAELYPGLTELVHKPAYTRAVVGALHWYLKSNNDSPDSGLILSQAALERLAFAHLTATGAAVPVSAQDKIEALFVSLDLPLWHESFPASLSRAGFNNGPTVINKVRNDLVHAVPKLRVALNSVLYDTWKLAQWYVELVFLRLSNFSGSYSNRLKTSWRGEVVRVPWATS